jgi:hypothetical protein
MNTIQLGNLSIEPSLTKTISEIHPAFGVVNDTAYVGVWLPCRISDDKGNEKFKDLLFLVTDQRKIILANDDVFRSRNLDWRLVYKPIKFPNRWSLPYVQAFLEGRTSKPIDVLEKVIEVWKKYLELPNEKEYLYNALWDIGTYFHSLFQGYPYVYTGGVKRAGKTKTLTVHHRLAFNAIFSNNMSVASIYRLIQNARATLLIDESEKLSYKGRMSERTLEFRSILLSGYKKGTRAYRIEKTKNDSLIPRPFETYSPKALANIQGLEDVIEDRCKPTILKRSRNKKIVNLEVPDGELFGELRGELYVLFLEHWREIQHIYNKICEFGELNEQVNIKNTPEINILVGRELELWRPIIALAIFFDRKRGSKTKFTSSPCSLTSLILELAIEDAKQRQTENTTETGEVILTQVLQTVVTTDDYYPVKTLKEKMLEAFDEEQKWITTRWIGNALRRLGFKDKRRVGTGYQYKLHKADVEDLAARLGLETEPENTTSIEVTFAPIQCFDCRRTLTDDDSFTFYEGKKFCFTCYDKIKNLEKGVIV